MANLVIRKIISNEKTYAKKKTAHTAKALAVGYYVGYAVTGQRDFLHKANFVLNGLAGHPDVAVAFLRTFILLEIGDNDQADAILSAMRPLRSALKNQDANLYAFYLYFNCVISIAKGKERAANKHYRALKDHCAEHNPPQGNLLLAAANCGFSEYEDAIAYLFAARKNGENSPFFFVYLARALEKALPQGVQALLLTPLLRWSLASGYHLERILAKNQRSLQDILRQNLHDAENLYKHYPLDWVLHIICTRRMIDNDLGIDAFKYYKMAETRQIHFQQLYDFLIRAAHKNGTEDVSRYSLAQYLKLEDIPPEIKPFVYHLVIKTAGTGNSELLEKFGTDILQFACQGMDGRLYGRYYYSVYKFLLENALMGEEVASKYVTMAEDIIKNLLFAYEINIDMNVRKIVAQEENKRSVAIYDVKGGRVRLNLCRSDARFTCLDESGRSLITSDIKINKLVENVGTILLCRFFELGVDTPEMLINLAEYFMNMPKPEGGIKIQDLSIKVLEAVAAPKQTAISNSFKMQARVALGNYYAEQRNFTRAVEYYRDFEVLEPKYIEQMLLAYIQVGDLARATQLALSAAGHISSKNLFHAVKRISAGRRGREGLKTLAKLAYDQLIQGWYDKALLMLVLDHHTTGIDAWIELARSLAAMGTEEAALYARILETAVFLRNCGTPVQGIFAKLAETEPANDVLCDFAEYIAYEVLTGDLLPEYAAIYAMEQVFLKTNAPYVAYALAHIYINNSIATAASFDILCQAVDIAEENQIIWPVFKDIKDKNVLTPYIEENMSFAYKGRADSDVTLFYRFNADDNYMTMPLRYLRFGLFMGHMPFFYGEEIEYYFEEKRGKGSITTTPAKLTNTRPNVLERPNDVFYTINTAVLNEQMFKYDNVEEILTKRLAAKPAVRAKMM